MRVQALGTIGTFTHPNITFRRVKDTRKVLAMYQYKEHTNRHLLNSRSISCQIKFSNSLVIYILCAKTLPSNSELRIQLIKGLKRLLQKFLEFEMDFVSSEAPRILTKDCFCVTFSGQSRKIHPSCSDLQKLANSSSFVYPGKPVKVSRPVTTFIDRFSFKSYSVVIEDAPIRASNCRTLPEISSASRTN